MGGRVRGARFVMEGITSLMGGLYILLLEVAATEADGVSEWRLVVLAVVSLPLSGGRKIWAARCRRRAKAARAAGVSRRALMDMVSRRVVFPPLRQI
jgi:hypothetical protein